ncbi:MAG: undecaprenyldiphospho-muramoylpentapeptide beta-N-acetylglucosaminyltransferase [Lachnospiraceae bacterium]|nr:undecaprenyldiphospho-muramoylpentapeptide beta-N-acetylglucosaminyltransferase [Lachnospiraceae bacterium]
MSDDFSNNPRVVLTGGGSAGHVTPNIALIRPLKARGFDISYIGSYDGIEKRLIADFDIPYYGISSGKLRRYFDPQNFKDPFKVIKGFAEARKLLKQLKPDIVFSKGGYVSVPVVRAAGHLKIPCILHESDMTPGLANKLCIPVCKKICCNFPETLKLLPENKAILTGTPIREELMKGSKEQAMQLCGFTSDKPVILVIGGSLGAVSINKTIRGALQKLLPDFQIIHITGNDKVDNLLLRTEGYKQFEYLKTELKDVFALADLVISRAGANAICELLALKKPNILIPLPKTSSRGDQLLNAASFEAQGFSAVVDEDHLTPAILTEKIHEVYFNKNIYIENMKNSGQMDATKIIVGLIENEISGSSPP